MFPIPASSIINFGNLSSTVQATIQQTNGYLCAGDSYELLQATGVMVACPMARHFRSVMPYQRLTSFCQQSKVVPNRILNFNF
jgi:hypothetical protein